MSWRRSNGCGRRWPTAMDDRAYWNDPAHEEIARLLSKGLAAPLSATDEAALDRLVAETPGGGEFAERFVDSWMLAGVAGRERAGGARGATPVDPDVVSSAGGTWRVRIGAIGAAAAVVLSAGAAWLWFAPAPRPDAPRLIAAGDAPVNMTLADGSRLALSRDGQLTVAMDGSHRRLRQLNGEAYYEVAKDRHRPFSVEVAGYRVTALGTRFNVAPDPSGLKVDLLEGRLRVDRAADGSAPVFITAGQSFRGGAHPSVGRIDPTIADWRYGRLVFDAVPLAEVARRLSRFSGRRIGIADASAGALRFSGVLRWDAPDDWAPAFEATLPVKIEQAPDGIEIARR